MAKHSIHVRLFILWMVFVLVLAACQAEAPAEEACPVDLTTGELSEDCLPVPSMDETSADPNPVEEIIIVIGDDSAYPIKEEDLSLLLKTWHLTAYAEDGVASKPPFRYLTFYEDGSYAIATEPDLITGDWTVVLRTAESSLILDPGTDNEVEYQLIDLAESVLNLRTWQGDVQIDEGYEPDDSGCVCD